MEIRWKAEPSIDDRAKELRKWHKHFTWVPVRVDKNTLVIGNCFRKWQTGHAWPPSENEMDYRSIRQHAAALLKGE